MGQHPDSGPESLNAHADRKPQPMNEVNRTLYIPLFGKARVSRRGIILDDPKAEQIWASEGFPVRGKSASGWPALNMAMRAKVFDEWTEHMLEGNENALVLQIGCGLDSRCERVKAPRRDWIDCDLPDVIPLRRKYYQETDRYHMVSLDASNPEQLGRLPSNDTIIVILEGLCMYLTDEQLRGLLHALRTKASRLHVLMDVYTVFGAKASRYGNPVNGVGVKKLYGIDEPETFLAGPSLRVRAEHSMTPDHLVGQLKLCERFIFRTLFSERLCWKFYRLYELESF